MKTFLKGLIFGSGFTLGVLVVAAIGFALLMMLPIHCGSPHSIVGKGAIEIPEYELTIADGKPMVLGSMENTTAMDLWNVIVEASLFSEDGRFLNKDSEYFPHFPAGGKLGFKLDFYDWNPDDSLQGLECRIRIAQGFDRDDDS